MIRTSDIDRKSVQFVFLGNTVLGENFQREHAFATELASAGFRVRYINGMPSAFAVARRLFAPRAVSTSNGSPLGVETLTPPMVPTAFRSSLVPILDRAIFRRWFFRAFEDWDWSRTILCVMFPYWWTGFLSKAEVSGAILLYDVCDALEVPSRNARALRNMRLGEKSLMVESDIVTCSAYTLLDRLKQAYPQKRAYFIPNGCMPAFFHGAERSISKEGPPTIGFVGALDERWIDCEMIESVCRAFPRANMTFAGDASRNVRRRLQKHANVTFLGRLPHASLPAIVQTFSVGIIPFKRNVITDAINPIKMYEYLAAGIPVVAIETAELVRYGKRIKTVSTQAEFVQAVGEQLRGRIRPKVHKRWIVQQTWQKRAQEFLDALRSTAGALGRD